MILFKELKVAKYNLSSLGATGVLSVVFFAVLACSTQEPSSVAIEADLLHDVEGLANALDEYASSDKNGYAWPVDFELRLADLRNDYDTMRSILDNRRDELLGYRTGATVLGHHYGEVVAPRAIARLGDLQYAQVLIENAFEGIHEPKVFAQAQAADAQRVIKVANARLNATYISLVYANQAFLSLPVDGSALALVSRSSEAIAEDLVNSGGIEGPEAVILDLLSFQTMEGDFVVDPFWDTEAAQLLIMRTWEAGLLTHEDLSLIAERIDRAQLPPAYVKMVSSLKETQ